MFIDDLKNFKNENEQKNLREEAISTKTIKYNQEAKNVSTLKKRMSSPIVKIGMLS
jgi:hypothetical protein